MISKVKNFFTLINPVRLYIVGILLFCVCSTAPENITDPSYIKEIEKWHQARLERLKDKNGWLSLTGLYWLEPGENTFGGDPGNDFVIRSKKIYPLIGKFVLNQETVRFFARKDIPVSHKDQPVTDIILKNDSNRKPTILKLGSLSWYIIKRGEKLGVRLKDSAHPRLQKLKKIETFPVDVNWRIEAKLEKFDTPRTMNIPTVLGTIEKQMSPGVLIFKIKDKTYRLYPLGDEDDLFLIFGDQTNGNETYGGGRFLGVQKPDSQGQTFLDFNKAYNPPCVFSPYATCPLPPEENLLLFRVTAGEKNVKGFDH